MENDAAIFRKSHRNVVINECGLFLCEEIPYVGVGPDPLVECVCCGKACLEVQCPLTIQHL